MPVQNLVLTNIEVRRFSKPDEPIKAQVRVDHNSSVTSVKALNDKALEMEFRFTASYGPVGIVKLEGVLRGQWDTDAKELEGAWRERKDMPKPIAQQIHQGVMAHCIPIAVMLTREVRLPPPIPMPQIRLPDKQHKTKADAHGPEVA